MISRSVEAGPRMLRNIFRIQYSVATTPELRLYRVGRESHPKINCYGETAGEGSGMAQTGGPDP